MRLGLADEVDRAASDTSLGQQQRMALAPRRSDRSDRVAGRRADEPSRRRTHRHRPRLLRAMVAEGSCVVVASHDHAVADVADRVLDLDR